MGCLPKVSCSLKLRLPAQALVKRWSPAERKERQELLRAKVEAEQAQLRVQQMEREAQVLLGGFPCNRVLALPGRARVSLAVCAQTGGFGPRAHGSCGSLCYSSPPAWSSI